MARIPYLSEADITDDNRDVLERRINLYWAAGHAIGGARNFSNMGLWLRFDSKFDTRLREFAILTVGYVTRAPYEWAQHCKLALDFGATEQDIRQLMAELDGEDTGFNAVEKAIIHGTAEMVRGTKMSDAHWDTLSAEYGTELMVELVMTVSFYVGLVRFLNTMEIDLEPEIRPWLDKFPLPA
ncbi:MAG: carboxymuconolactone decarboxylase family protein [Minwuia sp.]|uniref:carboxymuconolactone decarboxylase family protein n=1 Tax=Minwuia sp. TaxID=2493630 RepID=UPI003A8A1AAC